MDDYLELSLSIWENEGGALHSWWMVARGSSARLDGPRARMAKRNHDAGEALK